jgi:hypothetical protein
VPVFAIALSQEAVSVQAGGLFPSARQGFVGDEAEPSTPLHVLKGEGLNHRVDALPPLEHFRVPPVDALALVLLVLRFAFLFFRGHLAPPGMNGRPPARGDAHAETKNSHEPHKTSIPTVCLAVLVAQSAGKQKDAHP